MANSEPDRRGLSAEVLQTARRLRLNLATLSVVNALERAGIRSLVLKGPTLRDWLYDEDEDRSYIDCDLLVCPDDRAAAEAILSKLGYARAYDDRALPEWWRHHATDWVRANDGLTVDLHRTLPGIGASDETAWEVLWRNHTSIPLGQHRMPALSLAGRALHVALHAARENSSATLPDLERALEVGGEPLWREAAALAGELDALDAFVTGLATADAGRKLIERVELPPPRSVQTALFASQPPPTALGFEQLASASTLSQRTSLLRLKLFPPRAFMRQWDPAAPSTTLELMRAYARRLFWLARQAPPGFSAWRRARRSVRRNQDV